MKLPYLALITLALATGLAAQEEKPDPAENPATATAADAPAMPGMPGALPPGGPAEADGGLNFLQRSNFVLSTIRNNLRQMDPFGMPMDPTNPAESPVLSEQYEDVEDVPVLTNSSLKTALETLPISGIYPKKAVVVIGARSFSRGDQFGMKLEELTIRLRFEGIRGHTIYFKDLDTQEVASVDFNPQPAEFEPITADARPETGAGIVPMDELFIVN